MSFFDAPQQAATGRAAMAMAHRGGDRMHELTVINTPIGGRDQRGGGGGNLRSSWYQIPVHRIRTPKGRGFQSGVATQTEYAPHVESGTGLYGPKGAKYEIRPRTPGGYLRWVDPRTGREVFAKRVMHPGSPGAHMVATAAALVEAEFERGLVGGILDGWVRDIEAGVDR